MIDGISALSIDTSAWTDPAQRAALDSLLTQIQGQVNALISSLGTNIQTSATGTRIVLTSPVATPAKGQVGAGDSDWTVPALAGTWIQVGAPFLQPRFIRTAIGIVFIDGHAKNGSANSQIFNSALPVGSRPSATIVRDVYSDNGGAQIAGAIQITASGIVSQISGGTGFLSLASWFVAEN